MTTSPTAVGQSTVVIFDGSKNFWKTRNYLKILIVSHAKHDSLEVISYDPADGIELPRMYLDRTLVSTKLDKNALNKTFLEKKEALNRQKITKDNEELLNEIRTDMLAQYAFGRINVKLTDEKGSFTVFLQPSFDDITLDKEDGTKQIDVEINVPTELVPFTDFVKTIAKSKVNEFRTAHSELTAESALAVDELEKASVASRLVSNGINGFVSASRRRSIFNLKVRLCTLPRQRWMKAIHKVIVQNYVEAVRRRLAELRIRYPGDGLPPIETKLPSLRVGGGALGGRKKSFNDDHLGLHSRTSLTSGGSKVASFLQGAASAALEKISETEVSATTGGDGSVVRSRVIRRGSFDDSHIMENFMQLKGASASRDERDHTFTLPSIHVASSTRQSIQIGDDDMQAFFGPSSSHKIARELAIAAATADTGESTATAEEAEGEEWKDESDPSLVNMRSLATAVSNAFAGSTFIRGSGGDDDEDNDTESGEGSPSPTGRRAAKQRETLSRRAEDIISPKVSPSAKLLPIHERTTAAAEARKADNPFQPSPSPTPTNRSRRQSAGSNSRPSSASLRKAGGSGTATPVLSPLNLSRNPSPSPSPSSKNKQLSPLLLDPSTLRSPLTSPLPSARGVPSGRFSRQSSGIQAGGIASGSIDAEDCTTSAVSTKEHAGHIPGMRMVKRVGSFRHTEGAPKPAPLSRGNSAKGSRRGSSHFSAMKSLRELTISTEDGKAEEAAALEEGMSAIPENESSSSSCAVKAEPTIVVTTDGTGGAGGLDGAVTAPTTARVATSPLPATTIGSVSAPGSPPSSTVRL